MLLKNKIFSLLGFPEPIELVRTPSLNETTQAVLAFSLSGSLSGIISSTLTHLSMEQVDTKKPIEDKSVMAMLVDASQYQGDESFSLLFSEVQRNIKSLKHNARVVFIAKAEHSNMSHQEKAFAQGLVGFTKSLAKELGRKGITVNLLQIDHEESEALASPLGFFLSAESAFISGQSIRVDSTERVKLTTQTPAFKKLALVTGASQGIGAAIASSLARDNFKVVGVDIDAAKDKLVQKMSDLGGDAICLDISSDNAGQVLLEYLKSYNEEISQDKANAAPHPSFIGFDVIVHNAGITRDKTLAKMPTQWWESTLDINLLSVIKINNYLLAHQGINTNGRIVCMSSMNGIAGQVGQTNYATSKAGLIGYVKSISAEINDKGITINAIAPGFIETQMTEKMPFITRELGRRMNALGQGGHASDVAEAASFFAQPGNSGVTGQTLRVCGLNFIGA
jgi:3-oxoacyl-[acyl-carrier protein] reductase